MKYLFLFSIIFLAVACKKQDVSFYSGEDGITFFKGRYDPDSLSYSFAYSVTPKTQDTVFLPMRILGAAAASPRVITLKSGAGTTAREGVDFRFPETVLPAGALTIEYPVVVLNSAEMKNTSFRLVAEVASNKDFVPGATGTTIDNSVSLVEMVINITGKFIRPSYWPAGGYGQFGIFTVRKFRFMMEATGLTDFSREVIGDDMYYNLPVTLEKKLAEYEAVHGPLIDDETGLRVTFN